MVNPRIVKGRDESGLAVRGRVAGLSFQIVVEAAAMAGLDRFELEDRLLSEAAALIHQAEVADAFDWKAHGFERNEFDVFERTLAAGEVARLMQP